MGELLRHSNEKNQFKARVTYDGGEEYSSPRFNKAGEQTQEAFFPLP